MVYSVIESPIGPLLLAGDGQALRVLAFAHGRSGVPDPAWTPDTAGLLERWRNDESGPHLGRLAAVELPADPDFDPAAELADCLEQLALAGRREHVSFLIEKQRLGSLSEDEKAALRQLM